MTRRTAGSISPATGIGLRRVRSKGRGPWRKLRQPKWPRWRPRRPTALRDARRSPRPRIIVRTQPAELLMTSGLPDFRPIRGTALQYAADTDSQLFFHTTDREAYLLLSGRWFKAKSLARSVDPRRAARFARGLREDSSRQSAGRGAGLRAGHAAGGTGRARQLRAHHRDGEPPRRQDPAVLRWRAEVQAHRGHGA